MTSASSPSIDRAAIEQRIYHFFSTECAQVAKRQRREVFVEIHGHDLDSPLICDIYGELKGEWSKRKIQNLALDIFQNYFPPPGRGRMRHFVFAAISPQGRAQVAKVYAMHYFRCNGCDVLHRKEVTSQVYLSGQDSAIPCSFCPEE